MARIPPVSRLAHRLGLVAALATALGASGCGEDLAVPDLGSQPDGGWVINGHPFLALGQATVAIFSNDGLNTPRGFMVYLSDQDNGCDAVMRPFPGIAFLRFQLPINPVGTTNVDFANTVFGFGADVTPAAEAKSGKIVVNAHTVQTTTGTYDVIFQTGEHLAGVFNAPRCE